MTIRRDIKELAKGGLGRAVYGGITTLQDPTLTRTEFSERAAVGVEQKRLIAQEAVRHIPAASTIALDAGTTTTELARILPADEGLTVITASLPVVSLLAQQAGIQLVALGGTFHGETQSFAGEDTKEQALSRTVDMFFLATSAIRNQRIYCNSYFDAEVKRALISRAKEIVVVADSSKFGASAPVMVVSTVVVTFIITDALRSEEVSRHAVMADTDETGKVVQLELSPVPAISTVK